MQSTKKQKNFKIHSEILFSVLGKNALLLCLSYIYGVSCLTISTIIVE